jgi:hypothetical protein
MTTIAKETTVIRAAEELGPVLSGRFEAEELRERIEAAAASGVRVVVDFGDVEAMSPSFADELFAKMRPELIESGKVRFERLDDDLTALLHYVVRGRRPPVS